MLGEASCSPPEIEQMTKDRNFAILVRGTSRTTYSDQYMSFARRHMLQPPSHVTPVTSLRLLAIHLQREFGEDAVVRSGSLCCSSHGP